MLYDSNIYRGNG